MSSTCFKQFNSGRTVQHSQVFDNITYLVAIDKSCFVSTYERLYSNKIAVKQTFQEPLIHLQDSNSFNYRQKGLTLIELMISLLLGAFLIGGIIQIFVSTRQTNIMQEELSNLQENGRFAMDFLGRDIRMTDYVDFSCLTYVYPAGTVPIVGADNDGIGGNPNVALVLNGTDAITVRWVEPPCVTGVDSPQNRAYSITSSNAVAAMNLRLNGDDIVEGVENMQILYGVDTDTDATPNYYAPAGVVTPAMMPNVVSIRISLLLRTADNITSQPVTYSYMGVQTTPNDRRLRRVFNSTFTLRNRIR